MTDPLPAPAAPSRDRRAFFVFAGTLLSLLGLLVGVGGAFAFGTPTGRLLVCVGLAGVVGGLGALAHEYADHVHDRRPPLPRLVLTSEGQPALYLPRSPLRSQLTSATLVGLAAVALAGATFMSLAGWWFAAPVPALLALGLLVVATPGTAGRGAGGLWLTPDRLVHRADGVRWEVPWEDVAGALRQEPMPVVVHLGRMPRVRRGLAAGRARVHPAADHVLRVETRYLAGGEALAAYAVGRAVVDPAYRMSLGTPDSVPVTQARRRSGT